jgi:hypothetical protein
VLNQVVRRFTAKWPKASLAGAFDKPARCQRFRDELSAPQATLRQYTKMRADMANVEDLTDLEAKSTPKSPGLRQAQGAWDRPALRPAHMVNLREGKNQAWLGTSCAEQGRRFNARFHRESCARRSLGYPRAGAKAIGTDVTAGQNLPDKPTEALSGRGDNTTPVAGRLIPV